MHDTRRDWTKVPVGIFLVREEPGRSGSVFTAHSFDRVTPSARAALEATVKPGSLKLVRHRAHAMQNARSLEAMDCRFAGGTIAYDPTAVFTRTAEAVRCAGLVRAALGKKVSRVLLDSARRTLYVVLDDKGFEGKGLPFRALVAEAMALSARVVSEWKNDAPKDFELSVRMGFEPPAGLRLVPVDLKSQPPRYFRQVRETASRLRTTAGAMAVGIFTVGTSTAAMAGDPTAAVSQSNFTIIGQLGYDSHDAGKKDLFRGDVALEGAIPLGHDFGAQAEVAAGANNYFGVGGHVFWRDPSWGLIGGFASSESLMGVNMNRFGGEAEFYLDKLTISGRGGWQDGDVDHGGFGRIDLTFYATDNFLLRAGFEGSPHNDYGRAGIEFQPAPDSMSGLSLYADGTFGQGTTIFAGFKFHFGEAGKSLIYRDRHEDPGLSLFNKIPLKHYSGTSGGGGGGSGGEGGGSSGGE